MKIKRTEPQWEVLLDADEMDTVLQALCHFAYTESRAVYKAKIDALYDAFYHSREFETA